MSETSKNKLEKILLFQILILNLLFLFEVVLSINNSGVFFSLQNNIESYLGDNLGNFLFTLLLNITFLIVIFLKKYWTIFYIWISIILILFPISIILKVLTFSNIK